MSTTSQGVMTAPRRRLKQKLAKWRSRARSRNELMSLSDRCLQDIDISRCTSDIEATKPFWRF